MYVVLRIGEECLVWLESVLAECIGLSYLPFFSVFLPLCHKKFVAVFKKSSFKVLQNLLRIMKKCKYL